MRPSQQTRFRAEPLIDPDRQAQTMVELRSAREEGAIARAEWAEEALGVTLVALKGVNKVLPPGDWVWRTRLLERIDAVVKQVESGNGH